jgi:hypothetical protein
MRYTFLLVVLIFNGNSFGQTSVKNQQPLIFSEYFNNNNNQWPTNSVGEATFSLRDGRYIMENTNGKSNLVSIGIKNTPENYSISVSAIHISGIINEGYGLWFGAKDNYNGYVFAIMEDKYSIYEFVNNKFHEIIRWKPTGYLKNENNQQNILKVDVIEDIMRFYINGVYIKELKGYEPYGKKFGMIQLGNQKVGFDDILINKLSDEEVARRKKLLATIDSLFPDPFKFPKEVKTPLPGKQVGQTKYTYYITVNDSLKQYSQPSKKYLYPVNFTLKMGGSMVVSMAGGNFVPSIYVADSTQQPIYVKSGNPSDIDPIAIFNFTPYTGNYTFIFTSKENDKQGVFSAALVIPKPKTVPAESASFCDKLNYLLAMLPLKFAFVINGKADENGFIPSKINLIKAASESVMNNALGYNYFSSVNAKDSTDMVIQFNDLEKQLQSCLQSTHQRKEGKSDHKYIRSITYTAQGANEPVELNGSKIVALGTGFEQTNAKSNVVLSMSKDEGMFGTTYGISIFIY